MEKKISALREKISRFIDYVEEVVKMPEPNLSKAYLETKGNMITKMWDKIEKTNDDIEESEVETAKGTREYLKKDYETAFAMLDKVALRIQRKLEKYEPIAAPLQPNPTGNAKPNIKLKAMDIPIFSGDYDKWISFRNMFDSLVHDKTYTDLEKIHYLKSCLEGDAERVISQYDIKAESYIPAYDALVDRFHNEAILIDTHIIKILSQPKLHRESGDGLKEMMDVTSVNIQALKSLNIQINTWDPILLLLLVQKFDDATRRLWEQNLKPKTLPTMKQFLDFLKNRFHALGCQQKFNFAIETTTRSSQFKSRQSSSFRYETPQFPPRTHQSFHTSSRRACSICSNDNHSIFSCEIFRSKEPHTRIEMVGRARLCKRCLRHHQSECNQPDGCRVCGGYHHTFLHSEQRERSSSIQSQQATRDEKQSTNTHVLNSNHVSLQRPVVSTIIGSHHVHVNKEISVERQVIQWDANVLLATAIVLIRPNETNSFIPFRCLLDQGGEASHISESAVQRLGLTKNSISATMCGLGGVKIGTSDAFVEFEIGSKVNCSFSMRVQAVVAKKVANPMPSTFVERINWKHIDGLQLADPEFYKPGLKKGGTNCPVAQNTELGWILSGATNPDSAALIKINYPASHQCHNYPANRSKSQHQPAKQRNSIS
ncbi:uncharacterized protein LOC119075717 isoform X2 [Bradysia coprophila]|uniref:uncharacterized protein LOC119075717 isoform X2 n=1 Tax=Bradysia coprophila TaxID=38358 RepID=UPI00187DAC79|nr:uncharacterized protein LOC119075717 isoform X2 [Bradysia coprophila]